MVDNIISSFKSFLPCEWQPEEKQIKILQKQIMKVEKKQIDAQNLELTLSIEAADYAPISKKKFSECRRNADFKGFRKGNVPMSLIERVYGENALVDSVNDVIYEQLNGFIKDNKLNIIGEPITGKNQKEVEWADGNDFEFVFDMGLSPKVDVEVSASDSVSEYNITVTEKAKKEMSDWPNKWVPFYGNIPSPRFNTSLAKTLEKGKKAKKCPLDPIQKGLIADIKSADEEKSKEAQVLFDAIAQTKSDLMLRIRMEAASCSYRAYYDVETLLKYWPTEKKRIEAAYAKLKANPEVELMGKMFCKLAEWSKPDFTCKNAGEAKKIVQELNKMKKDLEKMKTELQKLKEEKHEEE